MIQDRRLSSFVLFPFLLLVTSVVDAAFTYPTLWKLDSIEKTYAGTWCFHPGPNPTFASVCANATLSALLSIHLHNDLGSGLSIAYYDPADGRVLGGAGWSGWRTDGLPLGLCMSGAVSRLDNVFRTVCRFVVTDDDHDYPIAHFEECTIPRGQLRVTDGCYDPPTHHGPFGLNDTASGVLTILGLLIVLPGMTYGVYRWYYARRAVRQIGVEEGLELPRVIGDSGAAGRP